MHDLIEDYKLCRCQLQRRIHELNYQLRNESLMTKDRERLTARRNMLTVERAELLCAIVDMQKHLKGDSYAEDSGKYQRFQLFPAERTDRTGPHQPETS